MRRFAASDQGRGQPMAPPAAAAAEALALRVAALALVAAARSAPGAGASAAAALPAGADRPASPQPGVRREAEPSAPAAAIARASVQRVSAAEKALRAAEGAAASESGWTSPASEEDSGGSSGGEGESVDPAVRAAAEPPATTQSLPVDASSPAPGSIASAPPCAEVPAVCVAAALAPRAKLRRKHLELLRCKPRNRVRRALKLLPRLRLAALGGNATDLVCVTVVFQKICANPCAKRAAVDLKYLRCLAAYALHLLTIEGLLPRTFVPTRPPWRAITADQLSLLAEKMWREAGAARKAGKDKLEAVRREMAQERGAASLAPLFAAALTAARAVREAGAKDAVVIPDSPMRALTAACAAAAVALSRQAASGPPVAAELQQVLRELEVVRATPVDINLLRLVKTFQNSLLETAETLDALQAKLEKLVVKDEGAAERKKSATTAKEREAAGEKTVVASAAMPSALAAETVRRDIRLRFEFMGVRNERMLHALEMVADAAKTARPAGASLREYFVFERNECIEEIEKLLEYGAEVVAAAPAAPDAWPQRPPRAKDDDGTAIGARLAASNMIGEASTESPGTSSSPKTSSSSKTSSPPK